MDYKSIETPNEVSNEENMFTENNSSEANNIDTPKEERTNLHVSAFYKAILRHKKLSEYLIGIIPFDWKYSKINYKGSIAESFELTPFDKAICGILAIDEVASFEQLGAILGMNVIDNPDERQYLDPAEKELLTEALQSLVDFEMIVATDDSFDSFSECRLTPLGYDYLEKGRKFKNKSIPFTLFYDHTTGQHTKAKNFFSKMKGNPFAGENTLNFSDENTIKALLKEQSNQSTIKEHSHLLQSFSIQKAAHYAVPLTIGFIADTVTHTLRLEVFHPDSQTLLPELSEEITQNEWIKENLAMDFLSKCQLTTNDELEKFEPFYETISKRQESIEQLFRENRQREIYFFTQNFYQSTEWIDTNHFLEPDLLKKILPENIQEVWMLFNELNEENTNSVKHIINELSSEIPHLLIGVPNPQHPFSTKAFNVWFFHAKDINTDTVFFKTQEGIKKYVTEPMPISFTLDEEQLTVDKSMHHQTTPLEGETFEDYQNIKKSVERKYFSQHRGEVVKYYEALKTNITKAIIEDAYQMDSFLQFFEHTESSKIQTYISKFQNFKKMQLTKLKRIHKDGLKKQLNALNQTIKSKKIHEHSQTTISKFGQKLRAIKEEMLDEYKDFQKKIEAIETILNPIALGILNPKMINTYIIDTNVFIDQPDIINKIPKKDKVVLSAKVLEELDYLKTRRGTKAGKAAPIANRNIRKALNAKRVEKGIGDISVLPAAYQNDSADNLILSVAFQYQHKKNVNAVAITSDNNFLNKLNFLEIKNIDLKTFLQILQNANNNKNNSTNTKNTKATKDSTKTTNESPSKRSRKRKKIIKPNKDTEE